MYHPATAFIVLTTDCNRLEGCPHCFYNLEPGRAVEAAMDTGAVVDVLGKLRLSGVGNVIFTGGEPALRPDLVKIVAAASGMGLSTLLLTNGLLLDEDLVDGLSGAGLGGAAMSLVNLGQEERQAASLLMGDGGLDVSFIFCFSKLNYEMIPEAADFAARNSRGIVFQPAFVPVGHEMEKRLSLRKLGPFDWSRIYTMLRPWAKESGLQRYLRMVYDFYHEPNVKPPRCSMSGTSLVVDADGRMFPCFHRRDMDCGPSVGADFSFAIANLRACYPDTLPAPCFGEHCISLHLDG